MMAQEGSAGTPDSLELEVLGEEVETPQDDIDLMLLGEIPSDSDQTQHSVSEDLEMVIGEALIFVSPSKKEILSCPLRRHGPIHLQQHHWIAMHEAHDGNGNGGDRGHAPDSQW